MTLIAIASASQHGEHHGYEVKVKHEYSAGGHGGHESSGGHDEGGHDAGGHGGGHEELPGAGSWGHGGGGDDHKYADHHPEYKFEYGVKDGHTKDHHSAWEHRDGDKVHGEYSLDEADGTKRIVSYTSDKKNGFQAHVYRTGKPHFDAPKAHHGGEHGGHSYSGDSYSKFSQVIKGGGHEGGHGGGHGGGDEGGHGGGDEGGYGGGDEGGYGGGYEVEAHGEEEYHY